MRLEFPILKTLALDQLRKVRRRGPAGKTVEIDQRQVLAVPNLGLDRELQRLNIRMLAGCQGVRFRELHRFEPVEKLE